MAPRISLITTVDTFGSVHMSLVQANSNSKIMEIFIIQFVQTLDQERPGWRKNTYWIWDNAVSEITPVLTGSILKPYHVSPATVRVLEA